MPGFAVHHQLPELTQTLMSTESVMPFNHLILCHPLLLPPSIFPSIRVFSNESVLCITWPVTLTTKVTKGARMNIEIEEVAGHNGSLIKSLIASAIGCSRPEGPTTWPKYSSFSFSISPSNEYSGLISFRTDWLDLSAVQGTLKSLIPQFKATILWHSVSL